MLQLLDWAPRQMYLGSPHHPRWSDFQGTEAWDPADLRRNRIPSPLQAPPNSSLLPCVKEAPGLKWLTQGEGFPLWRGPLSHPPLPENSRRFWHHSRPWQSSSTAQAMSEVLHEGCHSSRRTSLPRIVSDEIRTRCYLYFLHPRGNSRRALLCCLKLVCHSFGVFFFCAWGVFHLGVR